jgi:diguanylate cyclase (GGDEF)-like protein/PAS domain S-box-containing protein
MNQCPIDFSQRLFWLESTILGLLLLWRGSRQRRIKTLLCGLWGKISGKQSFRRVFENLPDPTWIISDNHFVEANPAALKAIGCEARSGLLYYHPSELSPELQPDGEPSFIKANRIMDEARKQGYQRFDWLHKKLDGTLFPVEVTIATIQWDGQPAILCSWRDISERLDLLAQVQASETKFREIFEKSPDAILLMTRDELLDCNQRAVALLGYQNKSNLLACKPYQLALAEQPEGQDPKSLLDRYANQALQREAVHFEMLYGRADGHVFQAEILLSAFNLLGQPVMQATLRDNSHVTRLHHYLDRMAHYDYLTQLPNRALFCDRLRQGIATARRESTRLGLVFIDINGFKLFNDTYGHAAGDRVLKTVADRLRATVRESDTVSRYGGDEFVALLAGVDGLDQCRMVVEKMLERVREPFTLDQQRVQVTLSCGIAIYPEDGSDEVALFECADQAMYEMKRLLAKGCGH